MIRYANALCLAVILCLVAQAWGHPERLCARCREMAFPMAIGKCEVCGGMTPSIGYKLCAECADKLDQCQACRAKLGGGPAPLEDAKNVAQPRLTITEDAEGKTIQARLGQPIFIELRGNLTTGYGWSVAKIEGDAVVQRGQVSYVQDEAGGKVGAGGVFRVELAAVGIGMGKVKLEYRRPWERDQPPARTFSMTVNVAVDQ